MHFSKEQSLVSGLAAAVLAAVAPPSVTAADVYGSQPWSAVLLRENGNKIMIPQKLMIFENE